MSDRFRPGAFTRAAMAGVLAAGLVPCAAFAADSGGFERGNGGSGTSSVVEQLAGKQADAFERILSDGNLNALYDSEGLDDSVDASLSSVYLPVSFDLRDLGVVTPVKNQIPWSTCWGFAAISAAETSILSELGTTYEATGLDLSERQLAWFAMTPLPDGFGAQAGEGYASLFEGNGRLGGTGSIFLATTMFGSGIGPTYEYLVPYQNNEGKALTYRDIATPEQIELKKQQDPDYDFDAPVVWDTASDWSVDEQYRFGVVYPLENSNRLPSPATWSTDSEGASAYSYNEAGTAAIKSELMQGRAVEIGFTADASVPGQDETGQYLNLETWAHYTYEMTTSNHAVTIVGWDDNYSKENFLEGHQPEHDGAWIVKNSWGSASEEFPNYGVWGVDGSGYFYLSYYDQSIMVPESLDFDVDYGSEGDAGYTVDSHSYLPSKDLKVSLTDGETRMADVFTAETDQVVRSVATQTATANSSVDVEVYLLDGDDVLPTDGKLVAYASGSFDYAGFHRIDLTSGVTMKDGQRYAVVATQRSASGQYQTLLNGGFSKEGVEYLNAAGISQSYYATGVVNRGESMLYRDGEWVDWVDELESTKDSFAAKLADYDSIPSDLMSSLLTFDNFPIKVYGSPYSAPTFADVSDGDWFAPAVTKVVDAGLMCGYENGEFGAGHALTRAELATILWRDARPADAEAYDFSAENATELSDVADGAFYTEAVNWAVANGVIDGVETADGSREFQPDRAVTFEEAVAMVAKYAKAPDGDVAALEKFVDGGETSNWSRGAMAWAVEAGLVNGEPTDDGLMLRPASAVMRERAAGVLANAIELKIIG